MDPKAKSPVATIASEKSAAKHSNPVKSSKSSQKKTAHGETVEERLNCPTEQIYSSDQKEKRICSISSGAKAGSDAKRAASLVNRVTDYLDDDADMEQREKTKRGEKCVDLYV